MLLFMGPTGLRKLWQRKGTDFFRYAILPMRDCSVEDAEVRLRGTSSSDAVMMEHFRLRRVIDKAVRQSGINR